LYDFRPIGVKMITVRNITYDGNVLISVKGRVSMGNALDEWAGVTVCSMGGFTTCS
jgi:hypothetical protein